MYQKIRASVSVGRYEIDALLSSEENVQIVMKKARGFLAAVETFKEALLAYSSSLQDDLG